MDMSVFNKGDVFALDVYDAGCVALGMRQDKIRFRFCLGEMHYMRYDKLKCLYINPENYVIIELTLYGIRNLKMNFNSNMLISQSTVWKFDEKDGELSIGLMEAPSVGTDDLQFGFDSYEWEYIGEYTPKELTVERVEELGKEMLDGFHDSDC